MSDWENEDFDDTPTVIVPPKKWDDEDEEEDVKESWEDSDQEEEVKPAPAPIKKVPLSQKIAEREERLRLEKEQKQLANRNISEMTPEEIRAQREEQKRLQEESDLHNAADLFAGVDLDDLDDGSNTVQDSLNSLQGKTLKTKTQFDEFSKSVTELILNNKESRFYPSFVETLVRQISDPLNDMDIRKVASALTAMANEKQKAAKDALKKKKSKKPAANVRADDFGSAEYGADTLGGEYDDFM